MLTGGRWRSIEREIDVTDAASFVEIGLAFEGEGTVWLDDVELSSDP